IPGVNDGTDMVRNIERLAFADTSVELNVIGNVALTTPVAGITGGLGTNRVGAVVGGSLVLTDTGPVGAIAAPVIGDTLSFNDAALARFGISDANGIVGAVTLQWQKQDVAHPGWVNITGATGSSMVVADQLLGSTIRLAASYTDGAGFHEQVFSNATVAIAATPAVNHAPIINQQTNPVGLPDTTVLEDRGVGGPAGAGSLYSSGIFLALDQVFRDDNTPLTPGGLVFKATLAGTLNGVNVDGQAINVRGGAANAAGLFFDTATTNAAGNQVGHLYSLSSGVGGANFAGIVSVRMTVTDAQGLSVTDVFNINVLPQNDGKATFNIAGARTPGSTLTVSQATPDPDGGLKPGTNYAFQWLRDGNVISGATFASFTTRPIDTGHDISVRTVYTDAQGFKETVNTDAGFITSPTVGSISLNDTSPTEGQTLTVNTSLVTDADGLGPFSFQWQSSANGTTWTNVAGATSASFVVPDAAGTALGPVAGQFLRVLVNVSDLLGNASSFSTATTRPVGVNYDASGSAAAVNFTGTAGDNIITGSNFADTLTGAAGDDILIGGGGNDALRGGTGTDIAAFNGAVTDFSVWANSSRFEVTDIGGTGGTDTLTGIEILRMGGTDYTVVSGTGNADTLSGGAGSQVLLGMQAADTIDGGDGSDIISGGAGNDTITGGNGDDFIFQVANTDGRDFVDGGAGTDTYVLTGDNTAETFTIMTRAVALGAGHNMTAAQLGANTEIVITRNGTGFSSVVALLDNIEEIKINTLLTTVNAPVGNGVVDSSVQNGLVQGDTIAVEGNFNAPFTSLAFNTIRIEGSAANDTIDISGLTSAHRVVFDANGGTDSVVGTLRPQDVVTGIPGFSASDLHVTTGTGVESDFQLMELVNHTAVAANDLVDHFALQSGHETVGLNAIAHVDMFLSSHDLLSGLDTTGPGNHQIAVDYTLLQA
ncbi:MAG: hypothetical protein ABMA14_11190, partial [Hyphomonadaceae bacterium]